MDLSEIVKTMLLTKLQEEFIEYLKNPSRKKVYDAYYGEEICERYE